MLARVASCGRPGRARAVARAVEAADALRAKKESPEVAPQAALRSDAIHPPSSERSQPRAAPRSGRPGRDDRAPSGTARAGGRRRACVAAADGSARVLRSSRGLGEHRAERGRGRPVLRLALQRPQDRSFELLRDVWRQLPRRNDGIVLQLKKKRRKCVRIERRPAGEKLVEHRAERIHVRRRRRGLAAGLLRRDVRRRAHDRSVLGEPRTVEEPRDSEVGELRHSVTVEEDVSRCHVTVHELGSRGAPRAQRRALTPHMPRRRGEPPATCDLVRERRAVDDLHRDERAALVLPHSVHLHDVRVVDVGSEPRLAEKRARYTSSAARLLASTFSATLRPVLRRMRGRRSPCRRGQAAG